ncbi:MAG: glycosyltransferase [Candidatus Helarchaeota archaeon]
MKILIIQETDWELRGPHQQHHLMERLSHLGFEIRVIDYDFLWKKKHIKKGFNKTLNFWANPKIIKHSKIKVIRPWIIRFPFLDYLSIPISHTYYILKEIKNFRPNIIIGFGILNCSIGLILAKLFRIPFYYYLIDHLHTLLETKFLQNIAKFFESFNVRNCNKLFVINKGLLDYSIKLGGKLNKIKLIPGGVDLNKFQNFSDKSIVRKRLGFTSNNIVIFFMGWLYNFSGLKEIADYLVKFESKYSNYRLLIVGEGDLYEYLKKKRDQLKNSNLIILTGKVPYTKIPFYLQAADFCILPAHNNKVMHNIVPIKLYEYLAAGKPVLATKLKGVYSEFKDNNGIIYIKKPVDIFNKIEKLIENREKLINEGLNFIKNYDWNIIIKKFLENLI